MNNLIFEADCDRRLTQIDVNDRSVDGKLNPDYDSRKNSIYNRSIAISLKRIADNLDKVVVESPTTTDLFAIQTQTEQSI